MISSSDRCSADPCMTSHTEAPRFFHTTRFLHVVSHLHGSFHSMHLWEGTGSGRHAAPAAVQPLLPSTGARCAVSTTHSISTAAMQLRPEAERAQVRVHGHGSAQRGGLLHQLCAPGAGTAGAGDLTGWCRTVPGFRGVWVHMVGVGTAGAGDLRAWDARVQGVRVLAFRATGLPRQQHGRPAHVNKGLGVLGFECCQGAGCWVSG